jgi:hypothetical protein
VRGKITDSRSEVIMVSRPPMSAKRIRDMLNRLIGAAYRKSEQLCRLGGRCPQQWFLKRDFRKKRYVEVIPHTFIFIEDQMIEV